MRVRTTASAVIAGAVLSAVLSLVSLSGGEPSTAPVTLDTQVLIGLRGAAIYLAIFLPLHFGLRRLRIGGRWAYAGIGAVAALAAVGGQTPLSAWRMVMSGGMLSAYLAFLLVVGAILGFLYHYRAGLEADGDSPALLARALAARGEGSGVASEDEALVGTGAAEYFNGPLQVRTSVPVVFIASLVSAGAFGLAQLAIGAAGEMSSRLQQGGPMPVSEMLGLAVQSQLQVIAIMGLIAPIPFSVAVLLAHTILKALDKQSYLAYLIAGLLAPLLLVVIAGLPGLLFGLAGCLPMAISMCVYRSMAGLEPKRVKEDIIVHDRRDLVGADHARRQFGRLIKG